MFFQMEAPKSNGPSGPKIPHGPNGPREIIGVSQFSVIEFEIPLSV